MYKKLLIFLISVSFLLTGCANSKQIDKASIAESVTVDENKGNLEYTFYLLSSEENPEKITVTADSFSQACFLAKEKYIPDLSLAKLELFIINEKIYTDVLKGDIEYISTKPYFSPQIYVTLSDKNSIKEMNEQKELPEEIEEQIILLKNKNKNISINCLSIFNNIADNNTEEFYVSYINTQNEMRADIQKIDNKKW